MKTFTLVLEWGDREEGLYHWAGQAEDSDAAERLAREEMDRSYNEQYWAEGDDEEDKRGIEGGHETEEYRVVECVEGVNEFAATDMLAALKAALPEISSEVEQRKTGGNAKDYVKLEAIEAQIITAIARGEGRQ